MAIGDPYITREQLKDVLEITASDEDEWIGRVVMAASRAIERRSGWPTFWRTESLETRRIDLTGRVVPVRQPGNCYSKVLLRTGVADRSGFAVAGQSTASLMPEDAISDGTPCDAIRLPFGSHYGNLDVTAIWGWPEVPADIEWAVQMQAHRYYRRKGSPEGIAGSAEWGVTRVPALDPDVLAILKGGGYMRAGIG